MDKIRIIGGRPLKGAIPISGAKNAALPLMAASLLTDDTLTLSNMPYLADIVTMANLLAQHGVTLNMNGDGISQNGVKSGRILSLNASAITNLTAPYELVRTMRASVLVLGPLLARFGAARVSLPGGCAIGTRPIDMHLKALEQMGAEIELRDGYIHAKVAGRLRGAAIHFEKVSVGATENILMSASLADGETVITNAACEPEVSDLANCLVQMGAQIEGIGTPELRIQGVENLHGCHYTVIFDRIEAGSFAAAAAITGGDVELLGARMDLMQSVMEKFIEAGVKITETPRGIRVQSNGRIQGIDIMTQPYPGFPTDMQAQFTAMLSVAEGASMMTETIFENRYMHVPELTRMGARVNVHGASAMIRGVEELTGAEVMATDLRASVSLVIAALAAKGATTIHRVYHLDRGYERLEEKLAACGAQIERVTGEKALQTESGLRMSQQPQLVIALPKGRIQEEVAPLLAKAGIAPEKSYFDDSERQLQFDCVGSNVSLIRVRSFDVATFVAFGAAHIGVAGSDVLMEFDYPDLYTPLDLNIGHCRLSVAEPEGLPAQDLSRMSHVRVATKYPNVTRKYFAERGIQAECIKLNGAMELAPKLGLAQRIVDLVSSGKTLKANGLRETDVIANISSRLIVNRAAFKTRSAEINEWIERFRGAVQPGKN